MKTRFYSNHSCSNSGGESVNPWFIRLAETGAAAHTYVPWKLRPPRFFFLNNGEIVSIYNNYRAYVQRSYGVSIFFFFWSQR